MPIVKNFVQDYNPREDEYIIDDQDNVIFTGNKIKKHTDENISTQDTGIFDDIW